MGGRLEATYTEVVVKFGIMPGTTVVALPPWAVEFAAALDACKSRWPVDMPVTAAEALAVLSEVAPLKEGLF
jgi:hypothetical protein